MNYCSYCLNHGFRFYEWKNHKDNCSLRRCVCSKCRQISKEKIDEQINLMGDCSQTPIPDCKDMTDMEDHSLTDESELISDPMEEVRSLAQELSTSDICEKDLQTCVLYALLESNEFSITETQNQLREARTAITESLILPAFNVNRELNLKRSRSPPKQFNDSNSSFPPNSSKEKSSKKLCPLKTKAKKSFPRIKLTANKCLSNSSTDTGSLILFIY